MGIFTNIEFKCIFKHIILWLLDVILSDMFEISFWIFLSFDFKLKWRKKKLFLEIHLKSSNFKGLKG